MINKDYTSHVAKSRGSVLYIVVPCYNEEEALEKAYEEILKKLELLIKKRVISEQSKIVFVDDGSNDSTWNMIQGFCNRKKSNVVIGIKLSRNCGHQNAIIAGLMFSENKADMVITADADLQDDIQVIDEFIRKYFEGNEIIYGVRKSRNTDGFLKRFTAESFYKILDLMGVEIFYNHADYRLMSSRAIRELKNFKEVNLFLRGIVPLIGFKHDIVEYDRQRRSAGNSKYSLNKMIKLGLDGVTSFSIKPIRILSCLGVLIFSVSFIMLVYFLVTHFLGFTVPGWTSIVISVWAIGGLQLLGIGILGEYVGKIYLESKARPRYIIEEVLE